MVDTGPAADRRNFSGIRRPEIWIRKQYSFRIPDRKLENPMNYAKFIDTQFSSLCRRTGYGPICRMIRGGGYAAFFQNIVICNADLSVDDFPAFGIAFPGCDLSDQAETYVYLFCYTAHRLFSDIHCTGTKREKNVPETCQCRLQDVLRGQRQQWRLFQGFQSGSREILRQLQN